MRNNGVDFGPFRFDLTHGLLLRGGDPVALGRRGERILHALLQHRGSVVSKADLLDAAWPGESVEESNLSVQVAQLRKRLGRTMSGGEWITTVERVGYRFVPDTAAPTALPDRLTLAVEPFTAPGGGSGLAEGMLDDLVAALSRFSGFALVPTEHGEAADFVLRGSVRIAGRDVRAGVQLVERAAASVIWAAIVDRTASDPLTAQREIAGLLAAQVAPRLEEAEIERSERAQPASASTRDLLLRAKRLMTASRQDRHAAAYRLLERVLAQEPENVDAISAAAEVLHHSIAVGWPALTHDDRSVSLDLAQRGTYLTRTDGAALGIFSNAMFTAREHDLGAATMLRGIDANPNSSLALVCAGLGYLFLDKLPLAEDLFRRTLDLGVADPNRKFAFAGLASKRRRQGQQDAAIALANQALALNPYLSPAYWSLIAAHVQLGQLDAARRQLASYQRIAPGVTVASIRRGQPYTDNRLIGPMLENSGGPACLRHEQTKTPSACAGGVCYSSSYETRMFFADLAATYSPKS